MTAYVTLVAISNVFLGMVLARIAPPSTLFPRHFASQPRIASQTPQATPKPVQPLVEASPAPSPLATPVEIADARSPAPADASEDEAQNKKPEARRAAPAAVKTWDDFAQYLRDVKDRTRYCRSAQDMKLARQAAEQLRACAQIWYSQFEACLLGDQLDEATQALVAGAEMSDIEMFAAQIETTLTNINALDWTGKVDEVLNCLDREMELLDVQQKSVASSGARAAARRKT